MSFLRERLHFQGPVERGHLIVLGVNSHMPQTEDLLRLALWSYVLYRTYNHLKHQGTSSSTSNLAGVMEHFLRDAIYGHDDATMFVQNCWNQGYRYASSDNVSRGTVVPKAKARRIASTSALVGTFLPEEAPPGSLCTSPQD